MMHLSIAGIARITELYIVKPIKIRVMEQYIPLNALVAEIEKLELCTMDEHMNYYSAEAQGEYNALSKLESFLDTIEVKEVYVSNPQFPHLKDIIGKVFGAGNFESWEYDDAEQLVLLAKDEVISRACEAAGIKKPYKDGNQWCILKGENIQEGICGFGDNIEDALVDFLRNIPKIPLEVKEVDISNISENLAEAYEYLDYTSTGNLAHNKPMVSARLKKAIRGLFDAGLFELTHDEKYRMEKLGLKAQKGEEV